MAKDTAESASQLIDRLVNDAQFRKTVDAAPTPHDKAQVIRAAGYGDVSLHAIQAALKERLTAVGAGVQADPARAKRVEELFFKAATDKELQQAIQAAATPEARREVLAQAGYGDITLDDLRAAAADLAQRDELSDEELELVAGGISQFGQDAAFTAGVLTAGGAAMGAVFGGPVGAVVGATVGLTIAVAFILESALTTAPRSVSDW